jgi:hypothetical protein
LTDVLAGRRGVGGGSIRGTPHETEFYVR